MRFLGVAVELAGVVASVDLVVALGFVLVVVLVVVVLVALGWVYGSTLKASNSFWSGALTLRGLKAGSVGGMGFDAIILASLLYCNLDGFRGTSFSVGWMSKCFGRSK